MDLETSETKESFLENEYVEFWIEDGIIYNRYKPEVNKITIDIAKRIVEDRLKVSNGVTRPGFVDLTNAISIDKPARRYLSMGESMKYLSASAILVKNEITKLGGNIYIRIDKPRIPTKLFTSEEQAVAWLEQFKFMS